MNGFLLVAGGMILVKMALYLGRKISRARLGIPVHPVAMGLRLGAPALGMFALVRDMPWPAMVLILIGEMIDRGEFYEEMEIPTPNSHQLDCLEARPEAHAVFGGK